ncbi:hypothetical protein ABGB18_19860 [Nonomuraea sp. B12E4]|uniref:hypothetical protein n=1 Tax=Nonomuraea sp. B12E4 TaxID=3153564 RepID=UPI00325F94BD
MSVRRRLGAPEDLETPRPLPGRSPVPQRITAIAVTTDLSRTAVATAAPWFPGHSEALVLADGAVARLAMPDDRGTVHDLCFDGDGSALTAMVSRNSIRRWALDGSGEEWQLGMIGSGGSSDLPLAQVAASSSLGNAGRAAGVFATANAFTQNVVVRDARSRQVLHDIQQIFRDLPHDDRMVSEGTVALDAGGSRVAFCRPRRTFWKEDEAIVVQEVGSSSYAEHRTGIRWANGLAFSPDGAAVAIVGAQEDQTLATIIDLDDPAGDPEPVVLPTEERVDRVNLRPVWCGTEPRVPIVERDHVTVWNLATASPVLSVNVPGPRTATTLSPDGRTLVIASPDDGVHAHPLP